MLRSAVKRILLVPGSVFGHVKYSNGTETVEKLLVFWERKAERSRLLRECLGIVADLSSRATGERDGEKNRSLASLAMRVLAHAFPFVWIFLVCCVVRYEFRSGSVVLSDSRLVFVWLARWLTDGCGALRVGGAD
jgi:hypothetical protein